MKKTTLMRVVGFQDIPRTQINMHPNEGCDLGLFTKSHIVDWVTAIPPEEFLKGVAGETLAAHIELLNECPQKTLQLNAYDWEYVGMPSQAIVFLDGNRLFLHFQKTT